MTHQESRKKVRGNKKSNRYRKGAAVCAILAIVLPLLGGGIAACYYAGFLGTDNEELIDKEVNRTFESTKSNFRLDETYINGRRRRFMSSNENVRYQPMSLADAIKFCAANGKKKLPVPVNKLEEEQLIEDVEIYHSEAHCDEYIIGYRLNPDFRYKALDGRKQWPSLLVSVAASIVTNDRDCVRLQLAAPGQSFAVIDFKPCSEVHDYHCVIGYKNNQTECLDGDGDHCFHTVYATGYNPEAMFNHYKSQLDYFGERENGLLLIDRDVLALEYIQVVYSKPKICWALDVKYDFEYLDVYENGPCPFDIVDVLLNPEHECLVIGSTTFKLETRHCKVGGCPLCEI